MDQTNHSEYKVTEEMVAAFLETVDNEAFILADIADVMGIAQQEATDILLHIMEHDILRLKCVWVPEQPPRLRHPSLARRGRSDRIKTGLLVLLTFDDVKSPPDFPGGVPAGGGGKDGGVVEKKFK